MSETSSGIITDKLGIINCIKCGIELDVSEHQIFESIICPNCNTRQTVPAKLGNFLLRSEIGQGGMGTVYLARDESLGRDVALKVLRAEYGADPKFYDQLVREAQAAAALNHPNIVQIYSFGQEKGQPYIVMELVNGGRLDQLMESHTPVDERVVLETAIDVAKGLGAAYDASLIHGDIKPANILFDRMGNAKVVDFGLARFEGGGHSRGEIWGTPYYIAPEKARGKNEDFRSDQYSLGATLFHALAGKPPFDGKTATDVVVARLKEETPLVNTINPLVTEATTALIARMMDPTPARRYPTYPSLLADLEEALALAQHASAQREKSTGKPQKKKFPVALLMLLLLLAIGGTTFAVLSMRKKGDEGSATPQAAVVEQHYNPAETTDKTPFTRATSSRITLAVSNYNPGSYFRVTSELNKHLDTQTRQGNMVAAAWLTLFQGIVFRMEGDDTSLKSTLQKMISSGVRFTSNPPPAESPEILARFLLGLDDEKTLLGKTAGTEIWFQDLRNFLIALDAVAKGKNTRIENLTEPYRTRVQTYHWAYSFRPQAIQMAKHASMLGSRDIADIPPDQRSKYLVNIKEEGAMPLWSK